MIVTIQGTTFITVDCFMDRYAQAPSGATFTYATGDMTAAKQFNSDAAALCKLVTRFTEARKIIPTMRRRRDLSLPSGSLAFEYLATKCSEGKTR